MSAAKPLELAMNAIGSAKRAKDFISASGATRRSEPTGDFEFAAHLGGVATIHCESCAFKHDECFRLLHVVEETDQRLPITSGVYGCPDGLMRGRGFARSDLWILEQDVVLGSDRLELLFEKC